MPKLALSQNGAESYRQLDGLNNARRSSRGRKKRNSGGGGISVARVCRAAASRAKHITARFVFSYMQHPQPWRFKLNKLFAWRQEPLVPAFAVVGVVGWEDCMCMLGAWRAGHGDMGAAALSMFWEQTQNHSM